MNLINENWESFRRVLISVGVKETDTESFRSAFCAGMVSMDAVMKSTLNLPSELQKEATAAIDREVAEFLKSVVISADKNSNKNN